MFKPLAETEPQIGKLVRTGQVILFGLSETANQIWGRAAADREMVCRQVNHLDACATYGASPTPTVIVVSEVTFDSGLASQIDPCFRRTTLIISGDNDQLLHRWQWVAWNTATTNEAPASIAAKLVDALAEAAARVEEWDRYSDFTNRLASLSPEERSVYAAVCRGRLNKQIAADLNVSIRTVEQRRRRLFDKMGVGSAVPLAAITARIEMLDDRIAREKVRESRIQSSKPGAVATSPDVPKTSARQPKFNSASLTARTPISSPGN